MVKARPAPDVYIKQARKLGARDAKLVDTDSIVTAAWVSLKCQYGCGSYGQCLTCPPHSPAPEQTAKVLACYRTALLIHGDDHTDVTEVASKLERTAFLDGYYKAFSMGSGPCRLCDDCNIKEGDCRNPHEARPSMEACGIDVFATAHNNDFPIEVTRNRRSEENYYGIVLLE